MKTFLPILTILISCHSHAQIIPHDTVILKLIYGKACADKNFFSRPFKVGEGNNSSYSNVTYKVTFKKEVALRNRNLLLCILEAPVTNQHGHRWGYRDLYFLEDVRNQLFLVNSLTSEEEQLLGDHSEYEIVEIGKNKKALVSTFQSTGNHHFEKNKSFDLLEIDRLSSLVTLDLEYDNSSWKIPENESEECKAYRYECDFKILKSGKDWYDIQVHRKDYQFAQGCKNFSIKSETDITFSFQGDHYIEKN